ncbi:pilin [Halorhodospira halophila]|uniref:Fimbrial protein pilin n=1 Tax=Halorhodospira halophila (strain DSM 244 / SL1) TaxID=349124 RepID=A1WZ94_HALHL|nr:pilin [Halorhodospira halophila]ABM63006.1 Fimbrial protein pilin [Halorhodospira halophila SL1]MBK1727873.1 pilin [Halorhodospira halophila]
MNTCIRRRWRCAAFTLIELMIVVAIIAMLAAIAVPQYQSYVARTQFTEALTLFGGVRTAVESEVHLRGAEGVNSDWIEEQVGDGGDYINDIEVQTNAGDVEVQMTFATQGVNAELAGQSVTFTGAEWDEGGAWSCDLPDDLAHVATGLCAE